MSDYRILKTLLIAIPGYALVPTGLFWAAVAVTLVGLLWVATRLSKEGSEEIVLALPVAGVLAVSALSFYPQAGDVTVDLCIVLLLGVAIGLPILAVLTDGRQPRSEAGYLVGTLAGAIGCTLSAMVITQWLKLPILVPLDALFHTQIFHFDLPGAAVSMAEETDRLRHNAGAASTPLRGLAFLLQIGQTILIAGWDAILLSIGVWVTVGVTAIGFRSKTS